MKIDGLIPQYPHSTSSGYASAYNSNALYVRLCEFTPNLATRTTRDLLSYEALVNTKKLDRQRKIEDAEITAGKAYLNDLWTYLQHWQAMENIQSEAPRYIANLADGAGKNTWSLDEIETEKQNVMAEPLITFPQLEYVVKETNPKWVIEYPHEIQELPGAKFLAWAPNLTITEADTLRKSLSDNCNLFENLLDKLGYRSVKWFNIDTFLKAAVPVIKPYDFTDYRWRFWALTGLWFTVTDGTPDTYHILPTVSGNNMEDIDAEGDETWLTDGAFGYIPDEAHAFNAIIKYFYHYYATDNPLGAVTMGDTTSLSMGANDPSAADKSYVAQIAINDVSGGNLHKAFTLLTFTSIGSMAPVAPAPFFDNQSYGCDKAITGDPDYTQPFTYKWMLGGYRYKAFPASVWNTNYNKERAFFAQIFRGERGSGTGKSRSAKSNIRGSRAASSENDDKADDK